MATKLPRERESKVLREIVEQSRRFHGVRMHRRNTGAARLPGRGGREQLVRFSSPGAADLWCVIPRGPHRGKLCEVEAKRQGERPTERQLAWLRERASEGAICYWADSARWAMQVLEIVLDGGSIRWDPTGDGYDVIAPTKTKEA